jgi:hypothetical protein
MRFASLKKDAREFGNLAQMKARAEGGLLEEPA